MRAQANEEHHPDLRAALNHLISAGGKRVRPTVVLLVGNMLGAPPERLIALGAAIEMLHTATLVHDDLIDGALLRRGIPTLNSQWSPAATVLTGDFIFARAAKLAAETDSVAVMKHFAETLAIMVNGELAQMFDARGIYDRTHYYKRIYAKTGSLFELASHAAALLCDVGTDVRERMRQYGYNIGMAFQIVDDILDFVGDTATLGKPAGSDLLNGLVTLPALYYIEANPDDPNVRLLAKGEYHNTARMKELIESIRHSEAIRQSLDEAGQFTRRALEALADLPTGVERQALEDLAHYIIERHV